MYSRWIAISSRRFSVSLIYSAKTRTWCILGTINNRCTHNARSASFYSLNSVLPWSRYINRADAHQSLHTCISHAHCSSCNIDFKVPRMLPTSRCPPVVNPCMSDVTVRQSARCSIRRTDASDSHDAQSRKNKCSLAYVERYSAFFFLSNLNFSLEGLDHFHILSASSWNVK